MGIQAFKTVEFTGSHHVSITSHLDMRGLASIIANTLGAFANDVHIAAAFARAHGGPTRCGGATVNVSSQSALTMECVLDNGHHAIIGVQDVARSSVNTAGGEPRQTLKATVVITSDPNLAIADSDNIFHKLARTEDSAADFHVRVETRVLPDNGEKSLIVRVQETEQVPATPDPSDPQTDEQLQRPQVKQYPPRPRITTTHPHKEPIMHDKELITDILRDQEDRDNQMLDDLINLHETRSSPASPDLSNLRNALATIRSTVAMIGARVDYTVTVSPLVVRAELLGTVIDTDTDNDSLPAGTVVRTPHGDVAVRSENGTWRVTGRSHNDDFSNIRSEGGTIIYVPTKD